jgi:hypothetical protein
MKMGLVIAGLLFIVIANITMVFEQIEAFRVLEYERREPGIIIYRVSLYWGSILFWMPGCLLTLLGGLRSKNRFFRLPLIILGILFSFEFMFIPITDFRWDPLTLLLRAIPGLVVVAEGVFLFGGIKKKTI